MLCLPVPALRMAITALVLRIVEVVLDPGGRGKMMGAE
jgi:hypothetical protein